MPLTVTLTPDRKIALTGAHAHYEMDRLAAFTLAITILRLIEQSVKEIKETTDEL